MCLIIICDIIYNQIQKWDVVVAEKTSKIISNIKHSDGKLDYSITHKAKILEAITKKEDLVPHFSEGWRLHHSVEGEGEDKKKKTFLTLAREADNLEVFKGTMFTVNEEALLEKVRNTPNYEFIFANTDYLNTLAKNYEANGFTLHVNNVYNNYRMKQRLTFS